MRYIAVLLALLVLALPAQAGGGYCGGTNAQFLIAGGYVPQQQQFLLLGQQQQFRSFNTGFVNSGANININSNVQSRGLFGRRTFSSNQIQVQGGGGGNININSNVGGRRR